MSEERIQLNSFRQGYYAGTKNIVFVITQALKQDPQIDVLSLLDDITKINNRVMDESPDEPI
jgi:hypothetical protein